MEESLPSAREVADNFEVNQWLGVPEGFMNQGPGIGKGPTRAPTRPTVDPAAATTAADRRCRQL